MKKHRLNFKQLNKNTIDHNFSCCSAENNSNHARVDDACAEGIFLNYIKQWRKFVKKLALFNNKSQVQKHHTGKTSLIQFYTEEALKKPHKDMWSKVENQIACKNSNVRDKKVRWSAYYQKNIISSSISNNGHQMSLFHISRLSW